MYLSAIGGQTKASIKANRSVPTLHPASQCFWALSVQQPMIKVVNHNGVVQGSQIARLPKINENETVNKESQPKLSAFVVRVSTTHTIFCYVPITQKLLIGSELKLDHVECRPEIKTLCKA